MSILPDEIWIKILEMGTLTSRLSYRDLCCISISCRRLNRLSNEPSLWSTLLALDFSEQVSSSSLPQASLPPSKSLYKTSFERDRARRHAAWRRAVLNAESQVAVCRNTLESLESLMSQESENMKAAEAELANLERARCASMALNVWQPEVIRGRQKQIVEQCTVPIESRVNTLKMEVRVCKQHIEMFNKGYNVQKERLNECKEALTSLKYLPVHSHQLSTPVSKCNVKRRKKRKRCN